MCRSCNFAKLNIYGNKRAQLKLSKNKESAGYEYFVKLITDKAEK